VQPSIGSPGCSHHERHNRKAVASTTEPLAHAQLAWLVCCASVTQLWKTFTLLAPAARVACPAQRPGHP
jgi:hypothetical protein